MAKLYFNYGVMGSSKTANALMTRFNYESLGKKTLLVKPRIDTRTSEHTIESRIGLRHECVCSDELKAFSKKEIKKYDCIIVDEAQFLSKCEVHFLVKIVDNYDIPVVCYGLKSDYRGKLFAGSQELLIMADKISEIKSVCWCGRKATFNARFNEEGKIIKSGKQVVIGANDKYTSLCRKHWIEGKLSND